MTTNVVPIGGHPLAGAPLHPPAHYFEPPENMPEDQSVTVVGDGPDVGRVFGYVHHWGTYLLNGDPSDPWTPPRSPTDYKDAMQGDTLLADGSTIKTANIGGGVNHERLAASFSGAVKHSENTASQLMRVRYGTNDKGTWAAGVIWPDVTARDIAMIRASGLSGDWRWRPEYHGYDMAGSQLVNHPGLPLRRVAALGDEEHPAILGGGLFGDGADVCPTCVAHPAALLDLTARVADLELGTYGGP